MYTKLYERVYFCCNLPGCRWHQQCAGVNGAKSAQFQGPARDQGISNESIQNVVMIFNYFLVNFTFHIFYVSIKLLCWLFLPWLFHQSLRQSLSIVRKKKLFMISEFMRTSARRRHRRPWFCTRILFLQVRINIFIFQYVTFYQTIRGINNMFYIN